MRIAVCEDDRAIREDLSRLIRNQAPKANVVEYQSGEELINTKGSFDIYFLDIEMGKVSGMDLARLIREQEESGRQRSIIIFVTGYREYMEEAFDVNAFHYLVKPVDNYKLKSVLWRALKKTGHNSREYIIINKERQGRKLLLRDIFYFEINGRIIYVHTEKGILDYYGKIGDLEKELHDRGFFRCHKGFLVNLDHVGSYNRHEVILDNGERIVIAKRRYNEFCREILIWMKKMEGIYES